MLHVSTLLLVFKRNYYFQDLLDLHYGLAIDHELITDFRGVTFIQMKPPDSHNLRPLPITSRTTDNNFLTFNHIHISLISGDRLFDKFAYLTRFGHPCKKYLFWQFFTCKCSNNFERSYSPSTTTA